MAITFLPLWKASMCQECARLHATYEDASARLAIARGELAGYLSAKGEEAFARRWKDCLSALRGLWSLREEMAIHVASHGESAESAMSSHG